MAGPFLGVFCPFWSIEGPHFILPLFQGMLRSLGAEVRILDLNLACAERLAEDWPSLSQNGGGLWSDPDRTAWLLEEAGVTECLLEAVAASRPAWIVFLSVNVTSYLAVRHLMRRVRGASACAGVRIAVGGPLCLDDENPRVAFPEADLVWTRTLESALPQLLGPLAPPAAPGSPIPRFRPDFNGIDLARYTRPEHLTYLLNYGCRFRCRFCHEGSQYAQEVARPTQGLAAELCGLLESLPTTRYVRFYDSSLNSDHRQFLALLNEFRGSGILWGCCLAPTPRIDDMVAQRMAEAGCMAVNVGVESGSTAVRRHMGKPHPDIDGVESCLRVLHRAGLDVFINLIVGYPGETEQDVEDTLGFLDRTAAVLSDVAVGRAGIYVGTPLFRQVQDLGIRLHGDADTEFVFNHWALADGSNTPELRVARFRRVESHLAGLRLMNARTKGAEDPALRALGKRRRSACAE